MLAIAGMVLGSGGIASIVIAIIQRWKPRADRAESLIDQVQEERDGYKAKAEEAERRGNIKLEIIRLLENHIAISNHHIYTGKGPPPPEIAQRVAELKDKLL